LYYSLKFLRTVEFHRRFEKFFYIFISIIFFARNERDNEEYSILILITAKVRQKVKIGKMLKMDKRRLHFVFVSIEKGFFAKEKNF